MQRGVALESPVQSRRCLPPFFLLSAQTFGFFADVLRYDTIFGLPVRDRQTIAHKRRSGRFSGATWQNHLKGIVVTQSSNSWGESVRLSYGAAAFEVSY
jgi:hypothetical protein